MVMFTRTPGGLVQRLPTGTSAENSNNPWRLERTATAAELSQYGNPTTCEIDNGGVIVADGFQASKAYSADSIRL